MAKWNDREQTNQIGYDLHKDQFYGLLNMKNKQLDLVQALQQWEAFYNQQRPHSSQHGKTPWEKFLVVKHGYLLPKKSGGSTSRKNIQS